MTLPPGPARPKAAPTVADPFYWTDESWGLALRCRTLDPLAAHVFTTRQLELTSAADWSRAGAAVGVTGVVTGEQVHGNAVFTLKRGGALPVSRPVADVIVSDRPDVAVAVRAADCAPILLADEVTGAVAAVHAGWRGTAASAVTAGLQALSSEFGGRPEDAIAVIGPCIGPCCYEVGTELVDAFAAAGHARHLIDRWFMATPPPRGSRDRPKRRVNVAGANRDQLILAGVPEGRIFTSGLCTSMHLDVLTSFRAEKASAGRLAAVIRPRTAPTVFG